MQEAQTKNAAKGCLALLILVFLGAAALVVIGLIAASPQSEVEERDGAKLEAQLVPEAGPQNMAVPPLEVVNLDEAALIEAAGTPPVESLDLDDGHGYRFVSESGPYTQIQFHANRVVVAWHVFPEPGFEVQNEEALAAAKRILAVAIGPETGPAAVEISVDGFKSNPRSPTVDVYVMATSELGLGMVTIHPKRPPASSIQ